MTPEQSAEIREKFGDVIAAVWVDGRNSLRDDLDRLIQAEAIALVERANALAEVERLRAKLDAIEALFADRPDTVCITEWRCFDPHEDWEISCRHHAIECVSLPLLDLRAALATEVTP